VHWQRRQCKSLQPAQLQWATPFHMENAADMFHLLWGLHSGSGPCWQRFDTSTATHNNWRITHCVSQWFLLDLFKYWHATVGGNGMRVTELIQLE
jgi:hypothetical protein